jgi:hypothetical protein
MLDALTLQSVPRILRAASNQRLQAVFAKNLPTPHGGMQHSELTILVPKATLITNQSVI